MSNSENYFSDSDKSSSNQSMEDFFSDSDDGYDYAEIRRIIASKDTNTFSNNYNNVQIKKKKKPKKKIQVNDKLPIKEFNQKIEKEVEDKKPKKWTSKRSNDKRKAVFKEKGIKEDPTPKRTFNPKLPPPTQDTFRIKKEEKVDFQDELNFPYFILKI